MAKLSRFSLDKAAIADGEWVTVGPLGDTFEILTKGFTSKYRDLLNSLRRQAARDSNRGMRPGAIPYTPDSLPPSIDDAIQGKALIAETFLDVRGLNHDDGTPVTADEYKEFMLQPEGFPELIIYAIGAAAQLTSEREEETKASGKSSGRASRIISNGAGYESASPAT